MKNGSRGLRAYTFGAKGAWKGLAWIGLLGLAVSIFTVMNAVVLKNLLEIASGDSEMSLSKGTFLAFLVIALQFTFRGAYLAYIEKTRNVIAGKAKVDLLQHIERLPRKVIEKYHSGDLLTRISDDTDIAARVLPDIGSALFTGAVSCFIAFAYAFYLSWQMALLCIVLSPVAALWSKWLVPYIQKCAIVMRTKESESRSVAQEEISNISVIKSFISYNYSSNKFLLKFNELAKARNKTATMNAILNAGSNIAGFLMLIGAASMGAYLGTKGIMTVGAIAGFLQLINNIVWPFSDLMPLVGELQEGRAARARLKEIEDIPCETETEAAAIDEEKMELRLDDVAFGYDGEPLFKNADFALKGKQFVGVMGPSGCGKSTLIKLLLALYEPSEGKIYLTDGEKDVKGTGIRHDIAYVPQDHPLMSGTILENIAYGEDEPDRERAVKAAEKAGISDFIETLPEKYDTFIKEKGDNVSFGQAQRIAIARAIYKDSPVLILDEPTASLDQSSKDLIMRTVKAESEKRLCIMICHDQTENREVFDAVIEFDGKGKVKLRNSPCIAS